MASLTGSVSLNKQNTYVWNLDFSTDIATTATLVITGGGSQRVLSFDGLNTDHELPLLGLKVGTAYKVDVLFTDAGGNTTIAARNLSLHTDAVNFDPVYSVNVDKTDKMEEGYTVLKNSHFVIDNEGDLVFQGTSEDRFIDELTIVRDPDRILEIANEMGVTFSPYSLISIGFTPDNTGILVSDLLGNHVEIPGAVFDPYQGLHHDVYLTDDNTILTFGNVPYYVPFFPAGPTDPTLVPNVKLKDQPLLEVSLDGSLVNIWSIADLVDQERTGYLGWNVHGKGLDWLHMNAVEPVPGEDAFIVSARHQDAVLKFKTNGELVWILGNPENWGPEFQPYLLTPVGDNFTWQYHQHAANLASDGDILLFDNGNYKASPFDGVTPVADEDNWSRAARYEVDEATMTVKLVWEYDANKELFGESGGDVNELANGNILVNFTNVTYRGGEPTSDVLGTESSAQLVEINPTTGEIVFDVTFGLTTYRAERISSLYNENVDESLNVSGFLTGGTAPDTLTGTDGKELIVGGAGDDVLSGLGANDTIYGDAGNDSIDGGSGNDSLYGGDGNDTLVGGSGDNTLSGGAGADTFVMAPGGGDDTIIGFENGSDKIDVSAYGLTSIGEIGIADVGGDTVLTIGSETLTLEGISTADIDDSDFVLAPITPPSVPTAGNDTLVGSESNDSIDALAGDDSVLGLGGNDTLLGGAGNDSLYGGDGQDNLDGANGNDLLVGGAGSDTLNGRGGADFVDGGDDNDILYGGGGDDTIDGGAGNDTLLGGDGGDSCSGGFGNDSLVGSNGNDHLLGDDGVDTLIGGLGVDTLEGGDGDDLLAGDGGADRLIGGAGNDTFRYGTIADSSLAEPDTIVGFDGAGVAGGDILRLGGIDANTLAGGNQAFSFIGTADFSHTAGELRVFDSGSNTVVWGDVDGDGVADLQIVIEDGTDTSAANYSAGDFVL